MIEVYKSNYSDMLWSQENQVMEITWLAESEKMNESLFKQEMLKILGIELELRPIYIILDSKEMRFVIPPNLQIWVNENHAKPLIEIGLSAIAVVASMEMIAQLSLEQTLDEIGEKNITQAMFDDKLKAQEWITGLASKYLNNVISEIFE